MNPNDQSCVYESTTEESEVSETKSEKKSKCQKQSLTDCFPIHIQYEIGMEAAKHHKEKTFRFPGAQASYFLDIYSDYFDKYHPEEKDKTKLRKAKCKLIGLFRFNFENNSIRPLKELGTFTNSESIARIALTLADNPQFSVIRANYSSFAKINTTHIHDAMEPEMKQIFKDRGKQMHTRTYEKYCDAIEFEYARIQQPVGVCEETKIIESTCDPYSGDRNWMGISPVTTAADDFFADWKMDADDMQLLLNLQQHQEDYTSVLQQPLSQSTQQSPSIERGTQLLTKMSHKRRCKVDEAGKK